MKTKLAALLGLLLVLSGCAGGASPSPTADGRLDLAIADMARAAVSPDDASLAADAINAFGLELFGALGTPDRNAVISPASIAIALGMARAGARGQTATEMDAVLRRVAADENAGWLNALDRALAARTGTFKDANGKDQPVTLRIANTSFAQRGMPIERAYLEALASRFGSGIRLCDFMADPQGCRVAINSWVDQQTEQRIPELLQPGDIDAMVRLVLVNAIYLKAAWITPFTETLTAAATFTRLDGSTVDVPTMHLVADLHYASGTGWQAVELPYVGGKLAMTVIVPDDLRAFQASLDGNAFASIVASLADRLPSVDLAFPKFGMETRADLASLLPALGMPTPFTPTVADFTGIVPKSVADLYISAVVHQANVDVDEKGTEAAAATAVVMRDTAMPNDQVTLRVDRPFLFALRDLESGAVLFLGRVTEPAVRS